VNPACQIAAEEQHQKEHHQVFLGPAWLERKWRNQRDERIVKIVSAANEGLTKDNE